MIYANPLPVNSLGVMLWGTSLEIDINKVIWLGVNNLTDLLLRQYLANPFHVNSLGVMLWGTFLKIT